MMTDELDIELPPSPESGMRVPAKQPEQMENGERFKLANSSMTRRGRRAMNAIAPFHRRCASRQAEAVELVSPGMKNRDLLPRSRHGRLHGGPGREFGFPGASLCVRLRVLIQYHCPSGTGWTRRRAMGTIRIMPREFRIEKLSDEFGQYTLVLKCAVCGHERTLSHTYWRDSVDGMLESQKWRSACGVRSAGRKVVP